MKTNHRRNFVARACTDNAWWGDSSRDKEADVSVGACIGHFFSNGHRGMAKAKRGAKKYIHSRMRFRQKEFLRELLDEIE